MKPKSQIVEKSLSEPANDVIEKMYLQINNISQGFAITILIGVLSGLRWDDMLAKLDFATALFAFSSFFISIVFWTRYYFDTVIIKRSFGVFAMVWFFLYFVAEGISFTKISEPGVWLVSTGIFLLFGAGFYVLNIREIKRKQAGRIRINIADNDVKEYLNWQRKRLLDLIAVSLVTLSGGYIVSLYPSAVSLTSFFALLISIWQLSKSGDYKRLNFIKTGL